MKRLSEIWKKRYYQVTAGKRGIIEKTHHALNIAYLHVACLCLPDRQGKNTIEELFRILSRDRGALGILGMHIITHSCCVSVSWKRLCVSVFDSSLTLAAMLTLVDQDTSPLLREKAYGEPAPEHSTGFSVCLPYFSPYLCESESTTDICNV